MPKDLTPEEILRIQDQLGKLAIQAAAIDLQSFLEVTEAVSSPQALASGINPRAVASAGDWVTMARLLEPFHAEAVHRVSGIRKEADSY